MNAPMQSASPSLLISPSDGNAGQITAIVERGFELHKAGDGPARHNLVAALQSAITLTNGLYEERRFREFCLVADTLTTVERFQEEPACDMLGRMLHNAAGSALYDDGDADLSLACDDRACRLLQHPSALNFRMLARLNH